MSETAQPPQAPTVEIPNNYAYKNLIPGVGVVEATPGYATGDTEIAAAHDVSNLDLVSAGTMGVAEIYMGVEFASNSGIASKLFGAGLILKGVKDHYEAISPAPKDGSLRDRIRERIRNYGNSLVNKNDSPGTLREKLKRGVGNELLTLQDIGYRNRVNRLIGSFSLLGVGLEMYNTNTLAGKIAGVATVVAAGVENGRSTYQSIDSSNDALVSQTAIAQVAQAA